MKKLLSAALAILMVASVFLMTGCMMEEDYYAKGDVDGFVTNLQNEIASKNDAALAEISGLKAIYEAKVALLDKEDEDLKAELKALTDDYNAKVKELEAADKATADALTEHKIAYAGELALLKKADTDNKAAIDALTTAYNAKVAELEAADKATADALAAHKTAYEAKVAELNGKISANETAISNLETELEAKINQVKADTEREIGEINALITQLQNADTTNANAIKALTDAYNAKGAELAAKDKAHEEKLKALTDAYNAKVNELEMRIDELESKHEHTYGEWESDRCESELLYRICLGCKEIVWKIDTPIGHTYKTEYDNDSHWKNCEVCEYETPVEGHTYKTEYDYN